MGDSYTIVSMYGSLYDDFKDIDVSTIGFGSSKTTDWNNSRNITLVKTIAPKNIFLHIGGNDIYGGADPTTTYNNLYYMINTLKSYAPNVDIYLMTLLYRTHRFDTDTLNKVATYNNLIKEGYKADQKVHIIDVTDKFLRDDGTGNESMFTDSTHPNSYGCAVISNATRSAMGLPLLSDSERFGSYKNAIATNGFSYEEIEENAFIDFVDIHLRAAWMYLGEIIGETSSESLLDELFSKFCLGK